MRILSTVAVFCLLLASEAVTAQEHLEPVEPLFDNFPSRLEYNQHIKKILLEGVDKAEIKFMAVLQKDPEYLVYLTRDFRTGRRFLVFRVASANIWYAPVKEAVTISETKKEIDSGFAKTLRTLFEKAVDGTSYSGNAGPGTGTHYFFSYENFGYRSGTIQSPAAGTSMYELTAIGEALAAFVKSPDQAPPASLFRRISTLTGRLQANERLPKNKP